MGEFETKAEMPQQLRFEDETGFVAGYLSTWDVDLVHDVAVRGAFAKTIARKYAERAARGWTFLMPMCYQHSMKSPIGGFTVLLEDSVGLYVEGYIDLDIELGRVAYSGLKKQYANGLSIGYRSIRDRIRPDGVRELLEIELLEGSVVAFPANIEAYVTTAKTVDEMLALKALEYDMFVTMVRHCGPSALLADMRRTRIAIEGE